MPIWCGGVTAAPGVNGEPGGPAASKRDIDGYPTVCDKCGERLLKTGHRAITFITRFPGGTKTARHSDCKGRLSS